MNMLFEANVVELKTELVKMNTNTGTAAYLMMKNAPKAYNLAQQYMCCIENNVTTLPKAYNELMGGVRETKGFVWATVKKYRMYWEKRDTIKEYWRTHATAPKELEMCNKTDWVEGYNGKPTQRKTSNSATPTQSVDILRLEGELKLVNTRLQNALAHVNSIGRHYEVMLPNEPPGPNRKAITDLLCELGKVQRLLTHDEVIIPGGVPQLE
jgi:hypothetical protein